MDKVKLQVILLVFITFLLLIFIIFSFFSIASVTKDKANFCKCTQEDKEYAKSLGYNKPEEACEFGIKIKKLVKERKLKELFLLVDGELKNGPRKKYIKNKKFSDIFSEEWRLEVLKSDPPCRPIGWRGFMLGNGLIWYNKSEDNKWHIISINDWIEEKFDISDLPVAWKIGDKIIPPQCFVREWLSSDNFKEYEKVFSIKNKSDFRVNTGKYLGKEISSFEPLTPSWSTNGETISLVVYLNECLSYKVELEINNRIVKSKRCNDKPEICDSRPQQYRILAKVSQKNCKKLAPYIPGKCISSYLLEVGDFTGGSYGWDFGYNIYGIFELNNKKKIIAPLKNFEKENDAINFIDTLNQE